MTLSTDSSAFVNSVALVIPQMAPRDRSFCEDVIHTIRRFGRISERQKEVLQNAVTRATTPRPAAPSENVGEMSGLVSLFAKASAKLKQPSIVLETKHGEPVKITMAGDRAKVPGSLNVTDGGPYGANVWYGRVHKDGTWEQPLSGRGDVSGVRHLLQCLSADPAGTAAEYGKLTGRCCFCNTGLTDDRSIAVGYGPVCAKNYGLRWGK